MHTLFFIPNFPTTLSQSKKPNIFTIGIGANIGNCFKTFQSLFAWFDKNRLFDILSSSPIYKNPPFGYTNQPPFYNATLTLQTTLCVREVFSILFYLERKFKRARIRAFKNAPRTLDIDLIFFNHLTIKYSHLKLPHPYWKRRESVIIPLILQNLCKEKQ